MAHPHNHLRAHHVEKSRVGHLTKGYARGGHVHSDAAEDKKLIKKMIGKALHPDGHKPKHRMDRPKRAKGGRVKGNAKTVINVITGGHPVSGAVPPGPPMAPPAPPMGVAPAGPMPPPMAGRPPMPPPGAAGMPPGGPPPMPMRARGGKVIKDPHGSPVFNESLKAGTQVQHTRGKGDLEQLSRGKPITYAKGGRVKTHGDPGGSDRLHFTAKESPSAMGIYRADSNTTNERARGGRIEASDKVEPATKLPGGSGGGEARLSKASRAKREYAGPIR